MWSARRSLAAIMLELVAIERHADAWPCRYENVKVPVDQGFGDDFVSKPDASAELGAERDTALGRCDLQAGRRADRAFKESTAIARNASRPAHPRHHPSPSQAPPPHSLVGQN